MRGAGQPEYSFSRSTLNVQIPFPVHDSMVMPRRASQVFPEQVARKTTSNTRRSIKKRTARSSRVPAVIQRQETKCTSNTCGPDTLLAAGRRLYGFRMGKKHDFMRHVLRVADVGISGKKGQNPAPKLLRHIKKHGTFAKAGKPRPGDLVFFERTHAPHSPEEATLVGIVERVDANGTIHFLAQVNEVVDRSVVTPGRPQVRRNESSGKVLNSYVRTKTLKDGAGTQYLAGQLWMGFGRF